MSATAAHRLERRTDVQPTRKNTRSHLRPVTQSATRQATRPATRPTARPATRPATRPTARPVEPTRARARRSTKPVAAAAPLRKRPENQPLPADLAAVAQTQLFRARVESTAEIERRKQRQPHLRVVPRRRRIASVLAPALIVVFLAMLGVTTFQTRMAENQVQLDRLLVKVDKARDLNVQLSRERAELLSPVRLGQEAERMKMTLPETVGFVTVDVDTYRAVLEGAPVTAVRPAVASSVDEAAVDAGNTP